MIRRAVVAGAIILMLPIQQMQIPGWPAVMGACAVALFYDVPLAWLVFVKKRYFIANVLGLLFFLGTAFSAWGPAIEALGVREYEGEGALNVPTYPIRFLVVITSAFAAYVYLYLMYLDWTGRLLPEEEEAARAR